MNIKEEKWLFYNDLVEYQNSIEGKKLDKAFKELKDNYNITEYLKLEELINDYYIKRNSNKLTYYNNEDLESGKSIDSYICDLYKEQN